MKKHRLMDVTTNPFHFPLNLMMNRPKKVSRNLHQQAMLYKLMDPPPHARFPKAAWELQQKKTLQGKAHLGVEKHLVVVRLVASTKNFAVTSLKYWRMKTWEERRKFVAAMIDDAFPKN
ncbi:Hypothetical protein NTJ_03907 [Nesidiocoris tenuis]|uniref:Uncharacterized protein n=1 Tax=Nesidiocoris tenuis TaxID=355587 RepID=A0ABN7AIA0_9HEMI|nr:Hypothetical protein NTJ_03907 [Nesidiocoris tenuis]